MAQSPPERGAEHHALEIFLGKWEAEGTSYGGTDQSGDDPKANGEKWLSSHEGYWHTGAFFLVQDERANIAGSQFDTISVMGIDPDSGDYFSRSFENHGFTRNYKLLKDGNVWTLSGDTERASIEFRNNNWTQVITWEWKPEDEWLPLCDRTAIRIG